MKHLEFQIQSESMKNWDRFRHTGILHAPDPMSPPDEFWEEEEIFALLKGTIDNKNNQNWYAHYQLGIYYWIRKKEKKAKKEWKKSYDLRKNPWACHGLGCYYLIKGKKEKKEALALLEKDGGLEMEDIREGEDSLEQLWADLNQEVRGKEREVPYQFVFKAF